MDDMLLSPNTTRHIDFNTGNAQLGFNTGNAKYQINGISLHYDNMTGEYVSSDEFLPHYFYKQPNSENYCYNSEINPDTIVRAQFQVINDRLDRIEKALIRFAEDGCSIDLTDQLNEWKTK